MDAEPTGQTLERSASPRLWAYVALAALGTLSALAAGRPELAIAAVPVAGVAVLGVVLAERPAVACSLTLAADRVVEGATVRANPHLATDLPHGRVDVVASVAGPVAVVGAPGPALTWVSWGGGAERRTSFDLAAKHWGVARLGPVWVRAEAPLGLVRWQGQVAPTTTLRVLPAPATLRSLLPHPDPRSAAGAHLIRRPGDGIEFADSRPYQPGDRLRSVNWPLSSRRGDLWVTERRPERSAELVLLVDTFADDPSGGSFALGRSARLAWLLAQAHLRAHDRVGLVGFGGYPAWITPGTGARGRLELLDRLLTLQAAWTEAQRSAHLLPRHAVPPGALVIAVSPLHDTRMVTALVDLRRRGLAVGAVRVDVGDLLPAAAAPTAAAARRLWAVELRRRASVLDRSGVPVVAWPAGDDPGEVLEAMRRALRAPVLIGRRR